MRYTKSSQVLVHCTKSWWCTVPKAGALVSKAVHCTKSWCTVPKAGALVSKAGAQYQKFGDI